MAKLVWQVTGQATDQVINTQSGQTIVGVQVFFITGEGWEGSVFVPQTIYPNKEKVREMIRHAARQLDEVGSLAEGTG